MAMIVTMQLYKQTFAFSNGESLVNRRLAIVRVEEDPHSHIPLFLSPPLYRTHKWLLLQLILLAPQLQMDL